MTETIHEVIAAMRIRHDAMKPGGARNGLRHWLDRFEAARGPGIPNTRLFDSDQLDRLNEALAELERLKKKFYGPRLTGIFDNRQTNRREVWENGRLGPTQPAERCPRNRPFGSYPDVGGV